MKVRPMTGFSNTVGLKVETDTHCLLLLQSILDSSHPSLALLLV